MKNKLLHEIKNNLRGPTKKSEFLARYIGAQGTDKRKANEQSGLEFWGIEVPRIREAAKKNYCISTLEDSLQWTSWLQIWQTSKIYDIKSVALVWLADERRKALRCKNWKDVFSLALQVDNWAHSDSVSQMISELIEKKPILFKKLKKWNCSKNPWLRRQSIVAIYYYARSRKKHVAAAQALNLVKNLLLDPHFYVQRGVGWTLREVDRVDSKKQRFFVRKNLTKISSVAWFATSELYTKALRLKLVSLRKNDPAISPAKL